MDIVYYVLMLLGSVSGVYDTEDACKTAARTIPTATCEIRHTR